MFNISHLSCQIEAQSLSWSLEDSVFAIILTELFKFRPNGREFNTLQVIKNLAYYVLRICLILVDLKRTIFFSDFSC